jgi:PhoPQ-activated pathogenicity-related protein
LLFNHKNDQTDLLMSFLIRHSGRRLSTLLTLFLLTFSLLLVSCSTEKEPENPFESYLDEPHPAYDYSIEDTLEGEGYTAYVIRMVSQEWLTEDIVDETEWWHWLTIVVPDSVGHDTGMLWIGGGSRDDDRPDSVNPMIREAALATNSITADLHNIPFQPLTFLEEGEEPRYEDDIIAYGWRKYLESGADDEKAEWLLRFPMTAAAQRAMDTITDVVDSNTNHTVQNYVVSGASKRGWTTWTTGIFDDRVVAIAPVVIDLLNIVPSFQHHWRAYGEWSPAIQEYVDEEIMKWQFSSEFARMLEVVDPYSYIDSLDMPKYIVNAASDEFFLPDSWQFYWEDLPGPKSLRYVPNAGHSMEETDASENLIAYYDMVLNDMEIPEFRWTAEANGFRLHFDGENKPDELLLWNAQNPDARDFRLYVIDRIWLARDLDLPEEGPLFVELEEPDEGFSASFIEATYELPSGLKFKQTTGIKVLPDIYPYERFAPEDSLGTAIVSE